MNSIKENVQSLMERLDYPQDAQKVFFDALDRIAQDKIASTWLSRLMAQYDESENCDYKQMLLDIKALGNAMEIHEYTSGMLLFLCLAEKLRERYAERGMDESIFYNSMSDLRYKLEECRLVYGGVGSFVCSWFPGFFRMTRFALGRLQFEVITTKKEYQVDGVTLAGGTKLINIHIPRTGTKLDHGEVLESYRMAAEVFAHDFEDRPMVFHCSSWMLDPWHATVLSPTSNMIAFYNDFKIVETGNYENYSGVWRLFDRLYEDNIAEMPRDTSLRRAYVDRIERGEPVAWGRGIFIYRDGKICNS